MKIAYPSREFDEAVSAACHGQILEEQARALNQLLRRDPDALDEYLLRLELHVHLASNPDLFAKPNTTIDDDLTGHRLVSSPGQRHSRTGPKQRMTWVAAAALVIFATIAWWRYSVEPLAELPGTTSKAVSMLDRAVEATWGATSRKPQVGDPLEPGQFQLDSGMVQVVFYNGARVVVEGPAEFGLVSSGELSIQTGRMTAEIAPQAIGFRVMTPQARVTDLGTAFGMDVTKDATELHVFEGNVELDPLNGEGARILEEGTAASVEASGRPRSIIIDAWRFASLFELQQRFVAAEASRYERWRTLGERLNDDPSLLLRLSFEDGTKSDWRLKNACTRRTSVKDGTVVGCQWTNGRWPGKQALDFQKVNDRVRLSVPGEFDSLTLSMWVRVRGLDRRINSLFMSDGFVSGTIHWSIRNDGVLGLTLIGPGRRNYEIAATPSVLTVDQLGEWIHLAVVVDGPEKRIIQYVNGVVVGNHPHRIEPPFTVGQAELGNWNAESFPGNDPFLIRNFNGAIDEFCLFRRAFTEAEIQTLYTDGQPQSASMALRGPN